MKAIKRMSADFRGHFRRKTADAKDLKALAVPSQPLTDKDVYRYRKQRGINLGAWFVLEKWMDDRPYSQAAAPGQSDHDVAKGENAKEILEKHWDSWITEQDLIWIVDRGFNTVRLPLGYYHLYKPLGDDYLRRTDFEGLGAPFEGAWDRIVAFVALAEKYSLGVLIDLHAAPGKQNRDAHSGTSAPEPNFLGNMRNEEVMSQCLRHIATTFKDTPNVVGLEILNEPVNNRGLQAWYERTIDDLRNIVPPEFPIVIHDTWDLNWYSQLVGRREDFVVCDHHFYRCYTAEDRAATAYEHAGRCKAEYLWMMRDGQTKSRGSFMVGEWSAALDPASMPGDWNELRRLWGRAELEMLEQTTASQFFWSLKKKPGDADSGWSYMEAVEADVMPDWVGGVVGQPTKERPTWEVRNTELHKALEQHTAYWQSHPPPTPREHWRFTDGYERGWDDAIIFAYFGNDKAKARTEMGYEQRWLFSVLAHHIREKGNSQSTWEYEDGWRQGYWGAMRVIG